MPPQAGIRKLSKKIYAPFRVSSDLYGASLGLVAEPWGVTTHAVRVIIVFSCANYFLLGRIGGALRLRLVTSQGSPYPARSC